MLPRQPNYGIFIKLASFHGAVCSSKILEYIIEVKKRIDVE